MPDSEAPPERQPLLRAVSVAGTEVYPVIHMIRQVRNTPLPHEALTAPDLTYTLIRPLLEKYGAIQRQGNMSVVFCLLLNRVYFFRDRHLTTAALSRTRADFCEILAVRALREHAHNMLELALVLTTSWSVYAGAPLGLLERAREEHDDDLEDRVGNAIEMAILSQSKFFIKSSPCQKVIDGIWSGKIVYQAESTRSILSDTYKRNPIHFYDPHKAPLLDHYRLKVPAIRSVLEYMNFVILFILFVCAIEFSETDRINVTEVVFMVYALGFTLEKVAAMQEHGIKVYFKGTWNGFDLAFVTLYCTYAIMRLLGVYDHHLWAREWGINCLALIAVLMFPRLAFVTFKNNMMVLSLRAMMIQFVALMVIAAFCFGGFLYALWTLAKDGAGYSAGTVAWWMLDLWFGLDASGFDNATKFHPVFGPMLMVAYACLSNTLLLTSAYRYILSHTFSKINEDASAEAMFRRAVSTIEGVKADSLFSYQPPVNLAALCIMLPASYILTPRWFHKVNVFMIRLTSFPILLCIAVYERQAKSSGAFTFYETVSAAAEKIFDTLPRHLKRLTFFEGLSGPDADIDAIFELEDELMEESALDMEETDDVPPIAIAQRRLSQASRRHASGASQHARRASGSTTGRSTPPVPASPVKAESSAPGPSTSPQVVRAPGPPQIPLPRARLNSIVTQGLNAAQTVASPLAQIFQPLIVDDDLVAEEQAQADAGGVAGSGSASGGGSTPAPTAMVSYGPATRRRLMSMHAAPNPPRRLRTYSVAGHAAAAPPPLPHAGRPEGYGATGESSTALRRFPTNSPPARSHLGLVMSSPLSESPDERGTSIKEEEREGREPASSTSGPGPRETASQLETEGTPTAGDWERRLESIEERQKRIEDMLMEISQSLRK
ncbi:hypothetical protein C8Q76DRAFT_612655 [Earliella scabrosa]|nr:hypothetical protein C8Q76DRAFT_612655 [Earliella scabrosa]